MAEYSVSPFPISSPSATVSGSLWCAVSGRKVTRKLKEKKDAHDALDFASVSLGSPGQQGHHSEDDQGQPRVDRPQVGDVRSNHWANAGLSCKKIFAKMLNKTQSELLFFFTQNEDDPMPAFLMTVGYISAE